MIQPELDITPPFETGGGGVGKDVTSYSKGVVIFVMKCDIGGGGQKLHLLAKTSF